jgi:isoquinoline 1-oxidoreductase alpha subunit
MGRERQIFEFVRKENSVITITVNGARHDVDVPQDMPLLWVIRDELGLTGTKFGCGVSQCGCCTVHVDGEAARSCVLPVSQVVGKQVHTIESLSTDNSTAIQKAWIAEQVPQCGYCQSGQIMAAAAFLSKNANPSDAQISEAITNICRCGTYDRIRSAIHRAAREA